MVQELLNFVLAFRPWSDEQKNVIRLPFTMRGYTSLIQGFSACGRTATVSAMTCLLLLLGISVLCVAPTNSMVDHIAQTLNEMVGHSHWDDILKIKRLRIYPADCEQPFSSRRKQISNDKISREVPNISAEEDQLEAELTLLELLCPQDEGPHEGSGNRDFSLQQTVFELIEASEGKKSLMASFETHDTIRKGQFVHRITTANFTAIRLTCMKSAAPSWRN